MQKLPKLPLAVGFSYYLDMARGQSPPMQATVRVRRVSHKKLNNTELAFKKELGEYGLHSLTLKDHTQDNYPERYNPRQDPNPKWKQEAIEEYRSLSCSDIAHRISAKYNVYISEAQMRAVLKGNVTSRSQAQNPYPEYIVRNPNGPDEEKLALMLQERIAEGKPSKLAQKEIKDIREMSQRMVTALYTDKRPWRNADLLFELNHRLAKIETGGSKVRGLAFEDWLKASFSAAGYKVYGYKDGNPGADLAAHFDGDEVLTGISCKSQAKQDEDTGKKVAIQALSPHGEKKIPETVPEARKAIKAALNHLENYQQILCLQVAESHFPDGQPGAQRYNMIEIPHDRVDAALRGIKAEKIQQAIDQRKDGDSLIIPIRTRHDHRHLFSVKVTGTHVGVVNISPEFYQIQMSIWAPMTEHAPTLDYQPSPTGLTRGRKKKKQPTSRAP
jgi:hypothetical protein